MREGVRVREITSEEGNRLLRIVRRSSGSVVTWRRAQMVLLSAQGMDVAQIAKVAFTSPDRVRAVLHNFNEDGFDSLVPRYAGGRPPTFTLPERREIKKVALSRPVDHNLPFSTWSLSKLAEFLVAEGVVDDISHEGLRLVLREEGVSFQVIKTYKKSNDPDFEAKKNRVLELYEIADGRVNPDKRVLWEVVDGPEEWIGTKVSWDLKQDGNYTVVLFKQEGWKEAVEFMHHCSTKWAVYLLSLKSLVETGKGTPDPNDIKIDNWN